MTVTATGASGASFQFEEYAMNTTWNDVPVIYMFAYRTITHWQVLYIGECQSAKTRLPCHERWDEAVRGGATHVLARVAPVNTEARQREERDLIASHKPTMNTHHVDALATILTGGRRA